MPSGSRRRRAQRGNYLSTLKLSSLNDSNPANDSREVALEIAGGTSAAAVQGARSAAGGGGGGGLEWLSLALLAGVACLRRR